MGDGAPRGVSSDRGQGAGEPRRRAQGVLVWNKEVFRNKGIKDGFTKCRAGKEKVGSPIQGGLGDKVLGAIEGILRVPPEPSH